MWSSTAKGRDGWTLPGVEATVQGVQPATSCTKDTASASAPAPEARGRRLNRLINVLSSARS